ncbi:MAG: TonB-dependent receptor [Planctomycetota bacterium]|nr:TonB-dependent receptor [Planctomycetota bacterium]
MPRRKHVFGVLFAFALLFFAADSYAQDDPPVEPPPPDAAPVDVPIERAGDLPEVVVTATRVLTPEQIVPRAMTVVDSKRILRRGVTSAIDSLDDRIGVWIEKRTMHTSDPVIRGLSGTNILTLVDGNTLSTFWGEGGFAGDDMYGKVDPDMLERIEVVRGPSSVLYGSNALGGVINFITKVSPFDYTDGCVRTGGRMRVLAASNPEYLRLHGEYFGATHDLRWLIGGTHWNSASVEDGGGQFQAPTRGHGYFGNARIAWKPMPRVELDFSLQHTHNPEVYRYYRPTQDNENFRTAVALTTSFDLAGRSTIADHVRVSLYYQDKEDRRRFFDAAGALQRTGVAKWKTFHGGIQARRDLACHEITYGIDYETTDGESPDDEQFTITPVGGTPNKASPDSIWSSLGIYVQDRYKASRWLTLTGSVRVDFLRFETEVDQFYNPPGGNAQLDEFTDTETAFVGGVQANVHVTKCTDIYGGWTRGFRQFAPRFGVSQTGFGVIVPSQLLDPVTADQFEVGVKHRARWFKADVVGYYTKFRNFQNIVRGTFQGQDWFDFDNSGTRDANEDVFVTVGNGEAYVYGVELEGELNLAAISRRLGDAWTVGGGFAWNYGNDQTNDIPIRHTHPAWGRFTLRYEQPRARIQPWAEFTAQFVRRYTRIPPSRLAGDVGYFEDPQDPTSGMRRTDRLPGYSVFDFRCGFKPVHNVTLVLGCDNIFDKLYRAAHARMDAPGRSFYLSCEIEL